MALLQRVVERKSTENADITPSLLLLHFLAQKLKSNEFPIISFSAITLNAKNAYYGDSWSLFTKLFKILLFAGARICLLGREIKV